MLTKQPPFEIHKVHTEVAFLVATSSPDSSCSTSIDSPTLLIPAPSLNDTHSSLGSSQGTPTVKFAPLPQMDPNRKRSLAPLGVPGRSRRIRAIEQEGGSLLWSVDPDAPDENAEDPIIALAKFVKKTSKTLWRRVKKGNKAVPREDVAHTTEPVLDIKSTPHSGDIALGEKGDSDSRMSRIAGVGGKRSRPASWSPLTERGTLSLDKAQWRSTSDLPHVSVVP